MKRRTNMGKSGFTLVELLVVIAIIGILIGMLLPAVQAVREAARRIQCGNQMKQMSLSLLNYESAHMHFPAGMTSCKEPGCTPAQMAGKTANPGVLWGSLILPYMEQQALYDRVLVATDNLTLVQSNSNSAFLAAFDPAAKNVISTYICPSCPLDDLNPFRRDHGKSNYVGVIGPKLFQDLEKYTNLSQINTDTSGVTGALSTDADRIRIEWPGVLGFNSATSMGAISDGTSNTFAVGERGGDTLSNGETRRASVWCAAQRSNWLNTGLGPTDKDPTFTLNSVIFDNQSRWANFSSSHTGGANFSRADGSVTFISDTINGDVYEAMGTKAGGEVTP